jgi:hypothetical protein
MRNNLGIIDAGALLSFRAVENPKSTYVPMEMISCSLHAYPNYVSSLLARQTFSVIESLALAAALHIFLPRVDRIKAERCEMTSKEVMRQARARHSWQCCWAEIP